MLNYFNKIYSLRSLIIDRRAHSILIGDEDSYLRTSGWMNSFYEKKSIDKSGRYVPFMNYSFVYFLDSKIKDGLDIFEYGSGYSTLYFSKGSNSVVSIERSLEWYSSLKDKVNENVKILLYDGNPDEYPGIIKKHGRKFDLIVVDDIQRCKCLMESVDCLNENGVVILDDSERVLYIDGIEFMKNAGFRELTIEGMKPGRRKMSRTSIFYRENNCFGI